MKLKLRFCDLLKSITTRKWKTMGSIPDIPVPNPTCWIPPFTAVIKTLLSNFPLWEFSVISSCNLVLQQSKSRTNLCAYEMTSSFDVPWLSMEWTQQLVLSPTKELMLFVEMVPNREWDFSKQLIDWGFLNHILRVKKHYPPWLVVNLQQIQVALSLGSHISSLHSAKVHIPFSVTTHSLTPDQRGSFLHPFEVTASAALWTPWQLIFGDSHCPSLLQQPLNLIDNDLVFSLAPWEEDSSCSAQASHQVCYLRPSTQTGWWLSAGSYLTTITSSLPPRCSVQPKMSGTHIRKVWVYCEILWISSKSFSPPMLLWKDIWDRPSAKRYFFI